MWTRGQATQCLRSGLEKVADSWKQEGGGRNGGYSTGRVCVTLGKGRGRDSIRGKRRGATGDRGKESGHQIRSWYILGGI